MWELAHQQILPSVARGDFPVFAESMYEYGRRAGECFAAVQRGPFNGGRIAEAVHRLRSWQIAAVGQSSWGPCVHAWFEDESEALAVQRRFERVYPDAVTSFVTSVDCRGASMDADEASSISVGDTMPGATPGVDRILATADAARTGAADRK
jgi:predicted sugar kinase